MKSRTRRKLKVGVVTSDKMDKTIAVRVDWLYKVPKYGKRVRRHTIYYAHDEANTAQVGDKVEIVGSRPLSKLKRWCLARVVRRSGAAVEPTPSPGERAAPKPEPAGPEPDALAPADAGEADPPVSGELTAVETSAAEAPPLADQTGAESS